MLCECCDLILMLAFDILGDMMQVSTADGHLAVPTVPQVLQPALGRGRHHRAALLIHADQEVHHQSHQRRPAGSLPAGNHASLPACCHMEKTRLVHYLAHKLISFCRGIKVRVGHWEMERCDSLFCLCIIACDLWSASAKY